MLCATKFRIPAFRSSYSLLKSRAVVSTSGISKIKKSFSKNKVNYYSSSSPSESPKQHLSMENFTAYCKRKGRILGYWFFFFSSSSSSILLERCRKSFTRPTFGVHDYGSFYAQTILPLQNEIAPPQLANVSLQKNPERSIVECSCQSAINVGRLKDPSFSFAICSKVFHR